MSDFTGSNNTGEKSNPPTSSSSNKGFGPSKNSRETYYDLPGKYAPKPQTKSTRPYSNNSSKSSFSPSISPPPVSTSSQSLSTDNHATDQTAHPSTNPKTIYYFSSEAYQLTNKAVANGEEHSGKHRSGIRGALRRAIELNDLKSLNTLMVMSPDEWSAAEFRRALKIALKRHTAGELRRLLTLVKAASITPAGAYLTETLGPLITKAELQLKKLEEWHKRLLQDWQHSKVPANTNFLRDKELQEEKVIDVYRRHKIHILFLSAIPALIFVVALLALLISSFFPPFGVVFVVLLILDGLWLAWTINDWRNDYLMVTNRRVLQYEKVTFFKEDKKALLIERVQQVQYEARRGLFDFLFQIGRVSISGIGKLEIKFDRVYLPDRIRKEISDAKGAYLGSRNKLRSARMENALRNKILGEPLKLDWNEEEPQLNTMPRDELNFLQLFIPNRPIEEGGGHLNFHRHPLFLFKDWFKVFVIYLLLIVAAFFVFPFLLGLGNPVLTTLAFVFWAVGLIWNTVLLWYFWAEWYDTHYVLTAKELIEIEKKPFGLDEEKSVVLLANVQDIQLIQSSVSANFFDYGDVKVTTAGAGAPIVFRRVPDPDGVRAEIARRMEIAKHMQEDNGDKLTLDYFAHYHKVNMEVQRALLAPIYEKLGIELEK